MRYALRAKNRSTPRAPGARGAGENRGGQPGDAVVIAGRVRKGVVEKHEQKRRETEDVEFGAVEAGTRGIHATLVVAKGEGFSVQAADDAILQSALADVGAWLSLARAPGSGPGGRRFESSRPDHFLQSLSGAARSSGKEFYPRPSSGDNTVGGGGGAWGKTCPVGGNTAPGRIGPFRGSRRQCWCGYGPYSKGSKKLGHPVPDSNLALDRNSGKPHRRQP